jgi:hypothetical protein
MNNESQIYIIGDILCEQVRLSKRFHSIAELDWLYYIELIVLYIIVILFFL